MIGLDRKYLVFVLVYAILGMSLGIFMAASHNHGQFVTHAHLLLIGFVVSLIYGVIHKLWLVEQPPATGSIIVLLGALVMLYMVLKSGAVKRA